MPGATSTWDSGAFGANWDAGLQWDVNVPAPGGNVGEYLALVTHEHADKPNFMTTLTQLLQPLADLQVTYGQIASSFDLDTAVGSQLDAVGQWVGISRQVETPLMNTWFSWDTSGLGWDEASWYDPTQPTDETVILPDDAYRTLIRAKVVNNYWDGSIPGAYEVWDVLFAGTGWTIDMTDNQDMSMVFTLRGPAPDAITMALLTGGYFNLRPAGVSATYGYTP
jgi:Protein of unknown function (DUF2612)